MALVSGGEGVWSGRAAAMTLRQSGAEEGRGCSKSDHQARAGTGALGKLSGADLSSRRALEIEARPATLCVAVATR